MKYAITVLIMTCLLSGCGRATFSEEAKVALPDVVEYSKAVQNKAADEMEQNNVPVLMEFMKDYGVMRDQSRAARGK